MLPCRACHIPTVWTPSAALSQLLPHLPPSDHPEVWSPALRPLLVLLKTFSSHGLLQGTSQTPFFHLECKTTPWMSHHRLSYCTREQVTVSHLVRQNFPLAKSTLMKPL